MSRIIAGKMIVGDDELHFRDDDAQKKLKDLIVQGKGDSETAVMSQAAATEEFDKLSEEIYNQFKNEHKLVEKADINFEIGGIAQNGEITDNKTRARSNYLFVSYGSVIKAKTGYIFNAALYSRPASSALVSYKETSSEPWRLPADGYVRVGVGREDNSEWTAETVSEAIDGLDWNDVYGMSQEMKSIGELTLEGILLENGGINSSGSLIDNNACVRSVNYITSHCHIGVKNPYNIQSIVYYDAETLKFNSYLRLNTRNCYIAKDGCVAKIVLTLDNETTITPQQVKNTGYFDCLFEQPKNEQDPLYRDVDYSPVSVCGYYSAKSGDYSKFVQTTLYAKFIEEMDLLVSGHSGYVTRTELGAASDGQTVVGYRLKPVRYNRNGAKPMPKIIIIAGQHGFEKSNVYGLYYFINDMLNHWKESNILDYLRHHVEFVIIPVVNPYGFDKLSYFNANGVNINRNYDSDFEVGDAGSNGYGGQVPFDQPETVIVRDLVLDHLDAVYFMDSHTNGVRSVSMYEKINWMSFGVSDSKIYKALMQSAEYHLSNITAHFEADYQLALTADDPLGGNITRTPMSGTSKDWALQMGIAGSTVEGFNGFPGGEIYTHDVIKANSEIIGNWITLVLNTMRFMR